jgi:hypothetical protein
MLLFQFLKISDIFQSINLALQSHPLQYLQKPPPSQTLTEILLIKRQQLHTKFGIYMNTISLTASK